MNTFYNLSSSIEVQQHLTETMHHVFILSSDMQMQIEKETFKQNSLQELSDFLFKTLTSFGGSNTNFVSLSFLTNFLLNNLFLFNDYIFASAHVKVKSKVGRVRQAGWCKYHSHQ